MSSPFVADPTPSFAIELQTRKSGRRLKQLQGQFRRLLVDFEVMYLIY